MNALRPACTAITVVPCKVKNQIREAISDTAEYYVGTTKHWYWRFVEANIRHEDNRHFLGALVRSRLNCLEAMRLNTPSKENM